ncbi:hypothetical protein DOTSEDRAFT_68636 [Dothistroma septosporum NZE10]|uniref:Uncharacterized protein n=1 Tax=Dothistroma septosporum (strain NZE10 / CBS 128990) TaxID=675120 RepID=N1Q2H2_DOTSN|nr:hypothetical protein DOTSEDRAFT_68636 [Dothistroma septosporum NZE10]
MERGGSPTPSCASQDCSNRLPRKSAAYRLFPIVEPTPPGTPVTLHFTQRASISRAAASSRRRSSSSDNAARELPLAKAHASAPPSAIGNVRKASLPEIRPLVTLNELDNDGSEPRRVLRPHTAQDRAPQDANGLCSNKEASPAEDGSVSQLRNSAHRDMPLGTRSSSKPLTPVLELHSTGRRLRTRERPNLRIAINKAQSDDKPLPVPPKSPEYPQSHSEYAALASPARQATDPASSGRPVNRVHGAQQQPCIPVNGDIKVVFPAATRGLASTKRATPPTHTSIPSDLSEKSLPTIGDVSLATSVDSKRIKEVVNRPAHKTLRSRLLPGSKQKQRQAVEARPSTPQGRQTKAGKDWTDLVSSESLMNRRSVTPDPSFAWSGDGATLSVRDIFPNATRPDSARSTREHDNVVPQATSSSPVLESTVPQSLSRSAGAALAAARANVAALRKTDSLAGSPEHIRTPASILGTFSGSTSDLLCPRPSSPGPGDSIIMTLKELSEQYESLHARYASLRAERQKLSGSIIESLKDQQPGPEYVNTLLDNQLTLAAISSSMDVCFARLKSLDCRREDAVAALVAKASQPEISPTDSIAAMIASASVSRNTSVTTQSSRYALTDQSTPDYAESYSFNRFIQSHLRSLSYGSEGESLEHRKSSLSRQPSAGAESNHYADSMERQAPETILEVVEGPEPPHKLETVQNPNEWKSSHPSPSTEMHQVTAWALDAVVAHAAVDDAGRLGTSGSDGSLDELLAGPPLKSRGKGAKAAKVLGLSEQSRDNSDTLMLRIPGLVKESLAQDTGSERDEEDGFYDVKEHSTSIISMLPNEIEDPVSPDTGDLDLQLQSFPRPQRLSSLHWPNKRDTGGSMLTNGSSADSSNGEQDPLPPPRSGRDKTETVSNPRGAARKRDPSAHTIQVYLENDEMLEYYNGAYRSRQA